MFVESSHEPSTDPIIVWFDGGPGISSMVGLFHLGPLLIQPQIPFIVNPYQWTARANLLFVDNPAGVGFSYVSTEEDLYNNDMSNS